MKFEEDKILFAAGSLLKLCSKDPISPLLFFPPSCVDKYFPVPEVLNCIFMDWISEVNLLVLRIQGSYHTWFLGRECYFRLHLVWSRELKTH